MFLTGGDVGERLTSSLHRNRPEPVLLRASLGLVKVDLMSMTKDSDDEGSALNDRYGSKHGKETC